MRDEIAEINETVLLFDNPSFDNSLVGITINDQAVYDLNSMILELMEDDGFTYEEAAEFIDYNTIRSLPYVGDKAPIIVGNRIEKGSVLY